MEKIVKFHIISERLIEKTCKICGGKFKSALSLVKENNECCSQECLDKYCKITVEKTCVICDNKFDIFLVNNGTGKGTGEKERVCSDCKDNLHGCGC